MTGQAHRIGSLHLTLAAPDRGTADRVTAAVRAQVEGVLLPVIGAALDRLVPQRQLVLLDRLELDLGDLGDDPDRVVPALTQALTQVLAGALSGSMGGPLGGEGGRSGGGAPGPDALAAMLAPWLATGGLAWPDPAAALAALWDAAARLGPDGQARLMLLLAPHCAANAPARRLLTATPPGVLLALVFARAGFPAPAAFAALPAGRAALARQVAALRALALAPQDAQAAALLAEALVTPPEPQAAEPQAADPPPAQQGAAAPDRPADRAPPGRAAPPDRPDQARADTAQPDTAPPLLAVPAAGLVLLHPYLAPCLDRLGLLAGPGRFADVAARSAAVRVVQRLATGAPSAPEAECALAKILCGLDPADALLPEADCDARLSAARLKAEGDALLRAVAGHWPRMQGTSAEGLRDAFLRRPGALDLSGPTPLLRVEGRGTDVLLDSLPWTIGLVRTPFMAAILRVEWGG